MWGEEKYRGVMPGALRMSHGYRSARKRFNMCSTSKEVKDKPENA
jgi:hypothetical protein